MKCVCGCNKEANYGQWIKGHWNKNKKWSLARKQIWSKKLSGEGNPFYGKHHSQNSIEKIKLANTGKKYSPEINSKKGLKGDKNPAYKHGYYELRERHKKLYKKDYCEEQGCDCQEKLELHHFPSLTQENFQTWEGKVKTLCTYHHKKIHQGSGGIFQYV